MQSPGVDIPENGSIASTATRRESSRARRRAPWTRAAQARLCALAVDVGLAAALARALFVYTANSREGGSQVGAWVWIPRESAYGCHASVGWAPDGAWPGGCYVL
ncbi:hypothetical protein PsYK624_012090 [Phanerochaete sordida]|uniref:Uncharacterized protein n=1 Tax=Phanerochaete sordida TaxID=48140 RepID=A0A9P3FYV6_9APHY|nr:hypothetical protein PsYK624_012090 [Phanerochaete sordida]